ncbi:hypothetical protein Fmac_013495 [Flemingia macrophylla]|uniref:Uncharacterized protein n=1 Tax=Flemingia macrophylla TaxID=520843 RepID=A0ABD1MTA2_9FABA
MKPHVEISRPPCLSEVHNPKMVSSWVTPISQPSILYYHLATLFREEGELLLDFYGHAVITAIDVLSSEGA